MTSVEAIILGIVQGATEFLPVSSSGHLVLAQEFLGWQQPNITFDVWLHLSTLLAVGIFFWKDLLSLTKKDLLTIVIASVPAAVIGLAFEDTIASWFGSTKLVAMSLLLTGLLNIFTNRMMKKKVDAEAEADADVIVAEINPKKGLIVGIFQALAIIPGISRSGSTVFAGTWQGFDRLAAFRFSFLLSIPAILGASLIQFLKIFKQGEFGNIDSIYLLASVAAFLTGLASLHIFKYLIKNANLVWFGYYCLVLGGGYLLFL